MLYNNIVEVAMGGVALSNCKSNSLDINLRQYSTASKVKELFKMLHNMLRV